MSAIEVVERELRELDYRTEIIDMPRFDFGKIVVFDYSVVAGCYRGRTFRVGVGFQEEGYPEYPPHFVFVADDLGGARLPKYATHDLDGWSVFSAPPLDFWDRLAPAEKNMKTYLRQHLARLWRDM